jgi:hypothetical protein
MSQYRIHLRLLDELVEEIRGTNAMRNFATAFVGARLFLLSSDIQRSFKKYVVGKQQRYELCMRLSMAIPDRTSSVQMRWNCELRITVRRPPVEDHAN